MQRWFLILFCLGFSLSLRAQEACFVENKGQWPKEVVYSVAIPNGRVFIERSGYTCHVWDLTGMHHADAQYHPASDDVRFKGHVWKVKYVGSQGARFHVGNAAVKSQFHYYLGEDQNQWAAGCNGFEEVIQYGVYPGIDLKWKIVKGELKTEWLVSTSGDYSLIKWNYLGVDDVQMHNEQLQVIHSLGVFQEQIPESWTMGKGQKQNVDIHYASNAAQCYFAKDDALMHQALVIDPQLIFSTYSGSTSDNFGYTATYDNEGYLYSGSSAFGQGYPTTIGAYQTLWGGGDGSGTLPGTDIAISKYDVTGTFMVWSTFIGGSNDELPHSLVVDNENTLWVYGSTGSNNFPVTTNALDTTFNGGTAFSPQGVGTTYQQGSDAIISHLSSNGSEMLQSSYWGGSGNDAVNTAAGLKFNYADEFRGEIDVAPNGQIVIVGTTNSVDFPTTQGGGVLMGMQDAFVTMFNSDLTAVVFSRIMGGTDDESGCSVAFDSLSNVFVNGGTQSIDFPISSGCYQIQNQGGTSDGWIMKLNEMGVVQKSTYFGSSSYDQLYFIDTDEQGMPYVYGQSLASGNYWIQNVNWSQANSGMVVAKLSDDLSTLLWSTTFGSGAGFPNLSPSAFLVDVCNQIYLSGWGGAVNQMSNTQVGTTQNLWVSSNAYQNTTTGSDFYLLVMDANATSPVYGSYYGGSVSAEHVDGGTSRFDRKGIIYQSVCAGCGNHDDFPIYPSNAVSSINASNNCNNGVFKYDFELSLTYALALFDDEICVGDSIYVQGQFQNAQSLTWELNGNPIASNLPSFWLPFSDTGSYYLNLIAIDSTTCNVMDQSGHYVHVVGPQIINQGITQMCEGDSVLLGIDIPIIGASYQWYPSENLSSDTLSSVVFYGNQSQLYALAIQHGLCTDTSYFSVEVDQVDISLPGDSIVCNASNLLVNAQVFPNNASILWSNQSDFSTPIAQGTSYNWSLGNFEMLYAQASNNGCMAMDSMQVSVLTLNAVVEGDQTVCLGDTVWVSALNPVNGVSYSWWPDASIISTIDSSAILIEANANNEYYLETSIPGCSRLDSITIAVSTLAQNGITLTAEPSVVFAGDPIVLTAVPDVYQYTWIGDLISGPDNQGTALLLPTQSQWVYCQALEGNCYSMDSIWIRVEEWTCGDNSIFLPTAFSPNENGENDRLYVYGVDDLNFSLLIFDRWGNEVFSTKDSNVGWDGSYRGKPLQSAVFHFILKVDCNGIRTYQKEGNITLMR